MRERWRPVVGFEGLYEVSDQGRVRSIDRVVRCAASEYRPAHFRRYKGQMLKSGTYTKQGHLSIPLGKRSHGLPVHALVIAAFKGPCPPGKEVLHKNGAANDNRFINLRYGTRSENNRDISTHGRRKLTVDMVRKLRKLRACGLKLSNLSNLFGICESQVLNVVRRRHYAHVA